MLEVLSLITEQSALDKISFLFLNHRMVIGGVPETQTFNLTFEPGKTFMDSGFSSMHGGSVGGRNPIFLSYHRHNIYSVILH